MDASPEELGDKCCGEDMQDRPRIRARRDGEHKGTKKSHGEARLKQVDGFIAVATFFARSVLWHGVTDSQCYGGYFFLKKKRIILDGRLGRATSRRVFGIGG